MDLAILHAPTANVTELALAPDGRRLASFSRDSPLVGAGDDAVRAWDIDPDAAMTVLNGHARTFDPAESSPDGRRLASGSWDDPAVGERIRSGPMASEVLRRVVLRAVRRRSAGSPE